ncbi:hypothetical protein ACIHCQ_14170 [Streptomyces sp. NPDC052236]|uniref:hypothetical protein n=1 Tax=Streptomyces sp. NPDC052236 TaxID=3365686 RepID=UPI0037CF2E75
MSTSAGMDAGLRISMIATVLVVLFGAGLFRYTEFGPGAGRGKEGEPSPIDRYSNSRAVSSPDNARPSR